MIRRTAPWFGTLLLVLSGAFLVGFGRDAIADPTTALLLAGIVAAGVLSIVGGLVESITIGSQQVPWHVLVGISNVVLGAVVVASGVRTITGYAGTGPILAAMGMIIGGVSLGCLGLETARDTQHIDLEASPSRSRLVAIGLLVAVSFGVGVLVVMVI